MKTDETPLKFGITHNKCAEVISDEAKKKIINLHNNLSKFMARFGKNEENI